MCGIFCLLSFILEENPKKLDEEFKKYFEKSILRRGPNSAGTEFYKLTNCNIFFAASVLWLQGNDITTQPIKNENSNFIYNGDIFGGLISEELRFENGDTKLFFEILNKSDNIVDVLSNIQGPYAFIYLSFMQNKLYFGRDLYGRKSLLIGKSNDKIIITSVAKKDTNYEFIELPSIGTFYFDLSNKHLYIYSWKTKNKNFNYKLQELESFLQLKVISKTVQSEQISTFILPNETDLKLINEIENSEENNLFEMLSKQWADKILKLKTHLENAVRKRVSTKPNFCQNCFKRHECDHSQLGILFSGGVDCAILTLLAEKFTNKKQSIDLINVAFDESSNFQTPDRLTAIETLKELQKLCPHRKWNLVEVNVTKKELNSYRERHISDLIYPLKSVLDDSLGCALWFASRAKSENYSSPSRILLVGMGADELFGGYTRHRAALQKSGFEGLHEVLEEDWQNLSHRNLARDDRVVSDHGRQLRTPYLDEEVVEFVRNLNCWEKTLPLRSLSKGVGEKVLLRCLAFHLGLKNAAKLTKRALQFGSRIANKNEKAHEVSTRL